MLVVGRDDVPGGPRRRGRRDRVLEGLHVLVPVRTLGNVGCLELPLLTGCVQTGEEPTLLLCLGDVQEELHDPCAAPIQVPLERVDVVVASLPEPTPSRPGWQPLALEPLGVDPEG